MRYAMSGRCYGCRIDYTTPEEFGWHEANCRPEHDRTLPAGPRSQVKHPLAIRQLSSTARRRALRQGRA